MKRSHSRIGTRIESRIDLNTSRLALSALALLLCATPPARAQQAERPCRLDFTESMTGPRIDGTSTQGTVELGPKMSQPGGGFIIIGRGAATVTYGGPEGAILAGGCTVIKNRIYTYSLQVFVTSEDGANGAIDMAPIEVSYPVAFKCMNTSGRAETETFIASAAA